MSKLILFDFECPKCGVFEELVQPSEKTAQCPQCKAAARRLISPVRIDRYAMATQAGATETSIRYFDRLHQQRKSIENRHYERHGDYGPAPGGGTGKPVTPEDAAKLG